MENRPVSGAYRPGRGDRRETLRRKTVRHETSTAQLRSRRGDRGRVPRRRRHRHPLPAASRRHPRALPRHAGHAGHLLSHVAMAARLERCRGHRRRARPRGAALPLDRHHDAPHIRLGRYAARRTARAPAAAPADAPATSGRRDQTAVADQATRPPPGRVASSGSAAPAGYATYRAAGRPDRRRITRRRFVAGAVGGLALAVLGGDLLSAWAP